MKENTSKGDIMQDKSKNTAISRTSPSKPIRTLVKNKKLNGYILDYGCGRGIDVQYLNQIDGIKCYGYDIYYQPTLPTRSYYDVILCTYVLNVINQVNIREALIKHIFSLTSVGKKIIITTRTTKEINKCAKQRNWTNHLDGYLTKSGTFQKGYTGQELIYFISSFVDVNQFIFQDTSLKNNFTQVTIVKIN